MHLFKLYLYLAMKNLYKTLAFSFLLFACGSDDSGPDETNDAEVVVQFALASSFDTENIGGNLPTLFLSGNVVNPSTVTVSLVSNGSATDGGVDFDFSGPVVVTIPVGSYDGTANSAIAVSGISIVDDLEEEEIETIEFALGNPTGDAVLGNRSTTVYSIIDNDGLTVSFIRSIASSTESQASDLPKIAVIGTVSDPVTVTVTDQAAGTATLGDDYTFSSPIEIEIPAGVYDGTEATAISIPGLDIIDDDLVEETEFFELDLTATEQELIGVAETRYEIEGLVPCEGGSAGTYPCNGYDLLGMVGLSDFNSGGGNDIWGWVDSSNGKEYALVGLVDGTAFVDVSGDEPIYLGKLPTATTSSTWRDVKIYQDFAFIVSEADNHGMQVFDLTRLRNVVSPPTTFSENTRYTGFGNAHNIVINEQQGFAYPVGTARNDSFNGGVHFIDISNPLSPSLAGGYGVDGYTHDAQVVTYSGPDGDYSGREIFIGANESQIAIVDITNKSNPSGISTLTYGNLGYTHQGWFTEDQRYYILGDELDEVDFGFNSRTLVFDVTDLDNPVLHTTYLGPTTAIDHNGYVLGNEYYLANYTAGVRVIDISDIDNRTMTEIGFFDTFPGNNSPSFDGVWSVYPYLPSGKILVNDSNSGLFIIRKSNP